MSFLLWLLPMASPLTTRVPSAPTPVLNLGSRRKPLGAEAGVLSRGLLPAAQGPFHCWEATAPCLRYLLFALLFHHREIPIASVLSGLCTAALTYTFPGSSPCGYPRAFQSHFKANPHSSSLCQRDLSPPGVRTWWVAAARRAALAEASTGWRASVCHLVPKVTHLVTMFAPQQALRSASL